MPPRKGVARPQLCWFLYLSADCSDFCSPSQGQRLDVVALRSVQRIGSPRVVFLLCGWSEATRSQSSVALPLLLMWNTMLLGSLLFWFRFTLWQTIILVPQALVSRVRARPGLDSDHLERCPLFPSLSWAALCVRNLIPVFSSPSSLACTAFAAWLNLSTAVHGG